MTEQAADTRSLHQQHVGLESAGDEDKLRDHLSGTSVIFSS